MGAVHCLGIGPITPPIANTEHLTFSSDAYRFKLILRTFLSTLYSPSSSFAQMLLKNVFVRGGCAYLKPDNVTIMIGSAPQDIEGELVRGWKARMG